MEKPISTKNPINLQAAVLSVLTISIFLALVLTSHSSQGCHLRKCGAEIFSRICYCISTVFNDRGNIHGKLHIKHVRDRLVQEFNVNIFIVNQSIEGLQILPSIAKRLKSECNEVSWKTSREFFIPLAQQELWEFLFCHALYEDNCPSSFSLSPRHHWILHCKCSAAELI